MIKTMAVMDRTSRCWRIVGHQRQTRSWMKAYANRCFRHQFNIQIRTGQIEAFSEFNPSLTAFLKTWDII